jgi:hypothetical protein
VILGGDSTSPQVVGSFELRTVSLEPAEQAVDLARLLSSKVNALALDGAGIRSAAPTPVGRRNKAAFSRAHCEGALLYVLRETLQVSVVVADPNGAARLAGSKKADLEARASAIISKGVDADALLIALCVLDMS